MDLNKRIPSQWDDAFKHSVKNDIQKFELLMGVGTFDFLIKLTVFFTDIYMIKKWKI